MNYYEYCKVISVEYYPIIYKEICKDTEYILKKVDVKDLNPFPNRDLFNNLVEEIFEIYKSKNYDKFKNGEMPFVDFTSSENICLLKDFIRVAIVNFIIASKEQYKEYPYYY